MIDRAIIMVRAGGGGEGAITFRKEKFVPYGGPDGGDGGDGGDVTVRADVAISDLHKFSRSRVYRAGNGGNGGGKKRHGKKGDDLILTVPVGTVVSRQTIVDGDAVMADLEQPGQQVVVAAGGKGGRGNTHFASSTNQAPVIAEKGEAGEEQCIIMEMRLIADIGIVGYPNVGKSTLIAAASAAKPRIASYPFTTLEPVLGVVKVDQESLILAEIPGLVADAHLGRGLGHEFLRHIMRTRLLLHLLDGSSASPVEDMVSVNTEIGLFDSSLAVKPQMVVVNKIDLPEVASRLSEIKKEFRTAGVKASFISAETGQGVPELMAGALKTLNEVAARQEKAVVRRKVFRPQPRVTGVGVTREGDAYVVTAPGLERLTTRGGVSDTEARWQLKRYLTRQGVSRALEKAGVKPGDKVRCGNLEWEW